MTVHEIFEELNLNNGTTYKIDVLKKHSDNELLKRVFKMALDKVAYNYYIRKIPDYIPASNPSDSLESALDFIENEFSSRNITGNKAADALQEQLSRLSAKDADIICRIIDRDLSVGIGKLNANKVWKKLIIKPMYMRCGVFSEKTAGKINVKGAYCQLKADGTYREATVESGAVYFCSRSGENYEYPMLREILATLPDGKYIGELTVISGGKVLERSKGNGLINSDNPPHEDIVFDVWDHVTLEEYSNAANKIKNTEIYQERFSRLKNILNSIDNRIRVIETHIVNDIAKALELTSQWMNLGLEGAILKDAKAVFRDGTNPNQLKLKLEIDADVRITGFTEGSGKHVNTFGSMTFETDDGQVKGSVSGFKDAERADFHDRKDILIGKIMSVQFNDLIKGVANEYHSLSHPRFIELRDDKDETDTLERIVDSRNMSMMLK